MPLAVDIAHVTFASYFAMLAVMVPFVPLLTFGTLYLAKRAHDVFRSAAALRRINRRSAWLMAGIATLIAVKG